MIERKKVLTYLSLVLVVQTIQNKVTKEQGPFTLNSLKLAQLVQFVVQPLAILRKNKAEENLLTGFLVISIF